MKKYTMIVDTESGYITLEGEAESREEMLENFRERVKTDTFKICYGNLYDFKEHTLKEVAE